MPSTVLPDYPTSADDPQLALTTGFLFLLSTLAALTIRKLDPPNSYIGRGNPVLRIFAKGALVMSRELVAKILQTK